MSRRGAIAIRLLWAMLAVVLVGGVTRLFIMRFDAGDTYPPYSTWRADPLGAQALYEALGTQPGVEVSRNLRPIERFQESAGAALVYLGIDQDEFEEPGDLEDPAALRRFAVGGGRLVIAMRPAAVVESRPWRSWRARADDAGTSRPAGAEDARRGAENTPRGAENTPRPPIAGDPDDAPTSTSESGDAVSLSELLGVTLELRKLERSKDAAAWEPAEVAREERTAAEDDVSAADLLPAAPDLPPTLAWHSGLVVARMAPAWRARYARGGEPVVIERRWGRGSVVLATDAYLLSNEGVRQDPRPELLAWMAGPARRIVFDERHLGSAETQGIMLLAWKYGLHGALAGLVLWAALFAWKISMPLVPPPPDAELAGGARQGRTAREGLVSMIGRHVPREQWLRACFEQWARGRANTARERTMIEHLRAILDRTEAQPARRRDWAAAYREMALAAARRRPAAAAAAAPPSATAQASLNPPKEPVNARPT